MTSVFETLTNGVDGALIESRFCGANHRKVNALRTAEALGGAAVADGHVIDVGAFR